MLSTPLLRNQSLSCILALSIVRSNTNYLSYDIINLMANAFLFRIHITSNIALSSARLFFLVIYSLSCYIIYKIIDY